MVIRTEDRPKAGGIDLNHVPQQHDRESWTAALERFKQSLSFPDLALDELGLPVGKAAGAATYFCPRCQQGQQRKGTSPTFYAYPDSFHCHKCAWHGDHLDLLEQTRLLDRQGAFADLKRRVEGDTYASPRLRKTATELEQEAAHAAEARAIERRQKLHQAAQLYASGTAAEESAEAAHYLGTVRHLGDAWHDKGLRFLAAARFSDGQHLDALLVPLTDAVGELTATQRIALQRFEGEDKRRRETVGTKAGAAWRPASPAGGALVLAEGVESALSAAILTGLPAWAGIDAGNLARLELPPEVCEVVIAADYDEPSRPFPGPGGTGIAKALEAAARLRTEGRKVTILVPDLGLNDASDALLAGVGLVPFAEPVTEAPTEPVGEREVETAPKADPAAEGALGASGQPQAAFYLPDFPAPSADRDRTLAAMRQTIESVIRDAGERVRVRRLAKEARRGAYDAKLKELLDGDDPLDLEPEVLTRLKRQASKAGTAAKQAALDAAGYEAMPPRKVVLIRSTMGSGKSSTAIKALLAQGAGGNALFLTPTLALAEQVAADWRKADCSLIATGLDAMVWYGRTQPDSHPSADGKPMCRQHNEGMNVAQKERISVPKAFCSPCPHFGVCGYHRQQRQARDKDGHLLLLGAHDLAFSPLPVKPGLVLIDENVIGRMPYALAVEPDELVVGWEGVEFTVDSDVIPAIDVANAVRDALLDHPGSELSYLRSTDLAPYVAELGHILARWHRKEAEEIESLGQSGAGAGEIGKRAKTLADKRHLVRAKVFSTVARELKTGRDGTNSVLLDKAHYDRELGREVRRIIVCDLRHLRLTADTEIIILDGSTSPDLYRRVFGAELEIHDFRVERQAALWMASDVTGTIARYTTRKRGGNWSSAEDNCGQVIELAHALAALTGTVPLVGGQKQVLDALKAHPGTADLPMLHHGAERGVNAYEHTPSVLHVCDEAIPPKAIEMKARAFMKCDKALFESALDPEGRIPRAYRRQRMTDGWTAPVEIDAHPNPLAQAVIEMGREGGTLQLLDRVRAVFQPRLMVRLGNRPIDMAAKRVLPLHTLIRVVRMAVAAKRDFDRQGWHVIEGLRKRDHDIAGLAMDLLADSEAAGRQGGFCQPLGSFNYLAVGVNLPIACHAPSGSGKGGRPKALMLLTRLPYAEALTLAAAIYPDIRPVEPLPEAPPQPARVQPECIPSWPLRRQAIIRRSGHAVPLRLQARMAAAGRRELQPLTPAEIDRLLHPPPLAGRGGLDFSGPMPDWALASPDYSRG